MDVSTFSMSMLVSYFEYMGMRYYWLWPSFINLALKVPILEVWNFKRSHRWPGKESQVQSFHIILMLGGLTTENRRCWTQKRHEKISTKIFQSLLGNKLNYFPIFKTLIRKNYFCFLYQNDNFFIIFFSVYIRLS